MKEHKISKKKGHQMVKGTKLSIINIEKYRKRVFIKAFEYKQSETSKKKRKHDYKIKPFYSRAADINIIVKEPYYYLFGHD